MEVDIVMAVEDERLKYETYLMVSPDPSIQVRSEILKRSRQCYADGLSQAGYHSIEVTAKN